MQTRMRLSVFGLAVLVGGAQCVAAQVTRPIGTLQPTTQAPPVIAAFVGDTVSFTDARAPFDTALKRVGSRYVCAKPGFGYVLRKYNRSANKKTTVIRVDTLVQWCFAQGTVIPAIVRIPGADTTKVPPDVSAPPPGARVRKPPR